MMRPVLSPAALTDTHSSLFGSGALFGSGLGVHLVRQLLDGLQGYGNRFDTWLRRRVGV